jgi:tetratricopeptide (TPR) repeat protein
VVVVHDVLAHDEADVIVMELVKHARRLRDALDFRTQQREVVRAFVDAARGLAAAHDANVTHRDFKPDNVLVDGSGRVVVVDFGLARDSGLEPPAALPNQPRTSLSGTPAYLAPERWLRQPANARNDQYSFCVALYECLCGALPFARTTVEARLDEMRRGPPPLPVAVNPRLERALRRGLSFEPADRWPSMAELGAELNATLEPPRTTRFALVAALGVIALVVASLVVGARRVRAQCEDADAPVKAVWTASSAGLITDAFAATKHPAAETVGPRVVSTLNAYATELSGVRRRACEATAFEGESDATLTQRQSCTSRRLAELRALAEALQRADAKAVERAVVATESLAPATDCLAASLSLTDAMPGGPKGVAASAVVPRVAQVKAIRVLGKTKESVAFADAVVSEARATDWLPLVSEALHERSAGLERLSKFDDARRDELEALTLALKSKDGSMAFAAAVSLAYVDGVDRQQAEAGATWVSMARALQPPASGLTPERLRLENVEAVLAMRGHRAKDAATSLAELERALAQSGQLETVNGARLVTNLSGALRESGRFDEAIAAGQRSLALMQKVLSPNHPDVAAAFNNLGSALAERERFAEAEDALRSAVEIRERLLGPEAQALATPLYNRGELALRMGNGQAALEHYRRCRTIVEKTQGADVDDVWDAKLGEGVALGSMGRHQESVTLLEQVLPQLEQRKLPAKSVAEAQLGLARGLSGLKRDEPRVLELIRRVSQLTGDEHAGQRRAAEALRAKTK